MIFLRSLMLILLPLVLGASSDGRELQHFFHESGRFFRHYVNDGNVSYAEIQENPQLLNKLYEMIALANLEDATPLQRKAFYINAYNLLVIKGVVMNYPVDSPRDIPGFFDEYKYPVAGTKMTLDEIEKQKLFAAYRDPRLHFVLVCAAQGCPPLIRDAYTPDNLDQLLDRQTRKALMDGQFIRVNHEDRQVKVSEIFSWDRKDFIKKQGSVLNYLNHYRTDPIPADYQVLFYSYDWSLNDAQ